MKPTSGDGMPAPMSIDPDAANAGMRRATVMTPEFKDQPAGGTMGRRDSFNDRTASNTIKRVMN